MHGNYIAFIYFVWISEQTVMFALSNLNRMGLITEVEGVYSAVRTEFLYNQIRFVLTG
jgi:predicted transcriptional regulator